MTRPAPESDEPPSAAAPPDWQAVSAFVQWDQTLPAGTQLREYQLRGVLSESDFAVVYLAWDHSLRRRVAVKEYLPRALAARVQDSALVECAGPAARPVFEAGLKAFVAEARLLARFDHAALIKVYRFWEDNGTAYLVMPHHEGQTLERTLAQAGKLQNEAEVRSWLRPVLDAISVMHAAGCYHHAIGPDAILMTPGGPVLLGLSAASRLVLDLSGAPESAVKSGYAAIEQYSDAATISPGPWTDLYALAAVAWRAIVGEAPVPASARLVEDHLPPLASVAGGRCTDGFGQAVDAALAVEPAMRPPSDAELRASLGGMESPLPTIASATTRDLMAEPFEGDDSPREVTVPMPTQPYPLPLGEATDPMARPFAASTSAWAEAPVAPAPSATSHPAETTSTRPSRKVLFALLAGVAVLGMAAAATLFTYAGQARGTAPLEATNPAVNAPVAPAAPAPSAESVNPAASLKPADGAPSVDLQAASANAVPGTTPTAARPANQPAPGGAARPEPADRSRPAVSCDDLLQEATLRRLSSAEAAFFKKECR